MKFKSNLLAQASGSVAGSVFSRNAGGMYMRNRSVPTNPNTPLQQAVRSALSNLSIAWGQLLSADQQSAWATYAANVPLINTLGDTRPISANAMYIRCNSPRYINAGPDAVVQAGPTTFALANFTTPTIAAGTTTHATQIECSFTTTDVWANDDAGYMFIYLSSPQSPTINFYKGPFRYKQSIEGDGEAGPTSPVYIDVPVSTTGTKYFVRVNVSNADGRLSSDAILSMTF